MAYYLPGRTEAVVQQTIDANQFADIEALEIVFTIMREDIRVALVYDIGSGGSIGAPLLISEGVLYAPACDGNIYAIRAADGTKVWRFATNGVNYGMASIWKETCCVAQFSASSER